MKPHPTPTIKGVGSAFAFVQHVVGRHQVPRGHLFPERPRRHPGQDLGHPQRLQGIEIGPGIDERRRNLVARLAVPGHDHKINPALPEPMHRAAVAIGRGVNLGMVRLQTRRRQGLMRAHPGNDGDFWFHNCP